MSAGLISGVVAAVLVLWLALRMRRNSRLFSDEHVLEVAQGLVGLKAAALARLIRSESDEPAAADDPRILATRAGLAIVYTVSERGSGFVHHCSVSVIGAPTTHAVGGTFLLLVARLLGLPSNELSCCIAESTVHHAQVLLAAERHAALSAAAVPAPSAAELAALRREALAARASVAWQRGAMAEG